MERIRRHRHALTFLIATAALLLALGNTLELEEELEEARARIGQLDLQLLQAQENWGHLEARVIPALGALTLADVESQSRVGSLEIRVGSLEIK